MLALVLAAVASTLWGAGDFVGGLTAKRISVLLVALITWGAGLLLTIVLVAALDPAIPPTKTLTFGLLGGVFGAVGLGSLYKGLAVGRMGIVAPIASLSVLVGVGVGYLQGDRPSSLQLVGMVAAVVGAVLAAIAPDPAGPREGRVAQGVGYGVLAAVCLGGTLVCLDAAGEASAAWSALLLRASSVPLVALAALVTRPSFAPVRRRDVGVLSAVGVADNAANVLFALATAKGLFTLVSVIASLVPVVTVLLARVVLHEHLTRHQLVGVVLALGGVVTIAAG
jgi:drug/metabolite transporter (DMT)-like permease